MIHFYFSLYSVIFHRTLLFFLKRYSNCSLCRESQTNPITQKKPAIQSVLNTSMGQTPCIAGFLDTNNKRIDRSIVSMLRSIFGGERGIRTLGTVSRAQTFQVCQLNHSCISPLIINRSNSIIGCPKNFQVL